LTHAQQVAPVYKKILAEFNKLIEGSKMQFNLEESSPTFLPMMHQGPIVTDIKTIIEDSRKRYVNPVGRTYTIPISDVLKGDLGEKYGDYFDANYHIQYHNDLDTLINLIERVYNANLQLADLMSLSKDTFTINDDSKKIEVTFIQQFEKTLSSKLGATLVTQVKSQLSNGLVSVKEIVSSTERFMSSVEGVSSPEQILEKVPLDQIKDKYTTTVTDVLQSIYEETLQILDSASDPANVSGGTRETNVELDKLKKKIQEFELLRRELRQSSKQLMALLGKYSSEKGMLLDMVKSGRALNYLLSGAEVGKRSEERKQKATEGGEEEEQ
jgi:hypothetical protein